MLQGAGYIEAHVQVLPDHAEALFGEHFSNLHLVALTTSASISTVIEDGEPVIVVVGPDPAVLCALDMLSANLANSYAQEEGRLAAPMNVLQNKSLMQRITVQTSLVGQIIGVKGRVADSLLKIHGTYITAGEVCYLTILTNSLTHIAKFR